MRDSIWGAYFTSPEPLLTLGLFYSSIAALSILYILSPGRPSLRLKAALAIILLAASTWTFLAASAALCLAYARDYLNYVPGTIAKVFLLSAASTAILGLPLALGLWLVSPGLALRRIELRPPASARLLRAILGLKAKIRGREARIYECELEGPVSLAVEGRDAAIVVSRGLTEALKEQELEAVLAHEYSHVEKHDTRLKLLAAAYRYLLPHDLMIRLAEAAIHRETEFRADEAAARITRDPLALAAALIKIYELGSPRLPSLASALITADARGWGPFRRAPPLKARVDRLLRIAEEMKAWAAVGPMSS